MKSRRAGRSGVRRRQRRKARRREREQLATQDPVFPVQQAARLPRRRRVRLLTRYLDASRAGRTAPEER